MAAMSRAIALTHLTQQCVHWRQKHSELSWEKREICPQGVISLASLHSFSKGAKWRVTHIHKHCVFVCVCDLISLCPSPGFTAVGLVNHSGVQSELLMATVFSFPTLCLPSPWRGCVVYQCSGRPTSSWGFSLALHHPASDMNNTHVLRCWGSTVMSRQTPAPELWSKQLCAEDAWLSYGGACERITAASLNWDQFHLCLFPPTTSDMFCVQGRFAIVKSGQGINTVVNLGGCFLHLPQQHVKKLKSALQCPICK